MTEYLLNPLNPRAGSEPDDFAKMGYDLRNIDVLERDLVSVAQSYPPTEERVFPDYATYRVEGYIATPRDGNRYFRTVWEIRPDAPRPRLITAYPVRHPQEVDLFSEFQTVALLRDIGAAERAGFEDLDFKCGDVGVLVDFLGGKGGVAVEFNMGKAHTADVLFISESDIRSIQPCEIRHARSVNPSERNT